MSSIDDLINGLSEVNEALGKKEFSNLNDEELKELQKNLILMIGGLRNNFIQLKAIGVDFK